MESVPSTNVRNLGLLVLTVLVWGYNWVPLKIGASAIDPSWFSAWRVGGGALTLFVVLALARRSMAPPRGRAFIAVGLAQVAGLVGFSTLALHFGGVANVASLIFTMPLFTAIFALPLLGERLSRGRIAWLLVAAAGIVVNGGTALLFLRGRHGDLNVRGAFLHMVGDAAVSLGVVVSSALILWTGWQWLDPLTSLGIVALITWSTWGLLRQSMDLAMDAVPPGVDQAAVQAALEGLPGVVEVHDLHIWGLSTTRTALTAHLVLARPDPALVQAACAMLHDRFGLDHATLQVEEGEAAMGCALRPAGVV